MYCLIFTGMRDMKSETEDNHQVVEQIFTRIHHLINRELNPVKINQVNRVYIIN